MDPIGPLRTSHCYYTNEQWREYQRQWRQKNKDKHNAIHRRYRASHKEWFRNYRKRKDPRKLLLQHAKQRSRTKKLPFDLTHEDIVIPKACPVLGIPLSKGTRKFHNGSPTLDRLVPDKGYVRGNVLVVSHRANRLRADGTLEEHGKILEFYTKLLKEN